MDVVNTLSFGIVSGLIATLFTGIFRSFWKQIIIPWYEERIYRDAHIEGRWKGQIQYPDSTGELLIFVLTRKSHKITGLMITQGDGQEYRITGDFRNMILTLTYESIHRGEVDRGTFTFLLVNNGHALNGYGAFYFPPKQSIRTAVLQLIRES